MPLVETAKITVDAAALDRLTEAFIQFIDTGKMPEGLETTRAYLAAHDLREQMAAQLFHPAPVGYDHGKTLRAKPEGVQPIVAIDFNSSEWRDRKGFAMSRLNAACGRQKDGPNFEDLEGLAVQGDERGFFDSVEHRAQDYGFDTYRTGEGFAVYPRGTFQHLKAVPVAKPTASRPTAPTI